VLSALRGFSAPVRLGTRAIGRPLCAAGRDPDLFNRWEAGQTLASDLILARASGTPTRRRARWAEAVGRAVADQEAEPAFKAWC
jgi:aminopeptidase N